MMRWTIACGSLLLAAVAQAGDPQAAAGTGRPAMDANGDGMISREEAKAYPRLAAGFDTWDTNVDGQLDATEMQAHREAMHGEMRAKAHEHWTEADKDGSGGLSRAEAEASMPRMAADFDAIDANKDGQVTHDEMHAFHMQNRMSMHAHHEERFKSADANGDGAIDLAEAQTAMPRLAEHFSTVDANGDGQVTPDEMRAAKKRR
jgi:Ca2+-binding EF-hand superfamily protein